jgi:hypothetical protein
VNPTSLLANLEARFGQSSFKLEATSGYGLSSLLKEAGTQRNQQWTRIPKAKLEAMSPRHSP